MVVTRLIWFGILVVVLTGCRRTAETPTAADVSASSSETTPAESSSPLEGDLWTAATAGDIDAVRRHLAAGAEIDAKESRGENTPLALASFAGHTEVAELLIEKGASLTIKNHDGSTPLHVAAFFAQPDTVKLLLQRGADTAAKNDKGQTALDLVSKSWSPLMSGYYRMVGGVLGVELDLKRIKQDRPKVAQILRDHQ